MTPHPTDDLAALAIGVVDAEEARAVRAPVVGCEVCGAELRALEEAAFAVAASAERDVPDGLRSKIVERARREGAPRRAPSSSFFDLFRRPAPLAIPVALAVLLLVSLAAYAGARRASRMARAAPGTGRGSVSRGCARSPRVGARDTGTLRGTAARSRCRR